MNDTSSPTHAVLNGLAGATGHAVGAVCHWPDSPPSPDAGIPQQDAEASLLHAFSAADARLGDALTSADPALAPLLEAQRLMLGDPELHDGVLALVRAGKAPAAAVNQVIEQLAGTLNEADTAYFRERAIDVRAVGRLLTEMLSGGEQAAIPCGAVVVAQELGPLDTARLAAAGVAALVTVQGGPTCHAAIMARAWGIPAIVGIPPAAREIPAGTVVLVDGKSGQLIVNPSPDEQIAAVPPTPVVRLLHRVPVLANVGSLAEAERARDMGAEGIGLLRTEFLFQDRTTPPKEDEQFELYLAILRKMAGRPVVARTLDIGADKPAPFLPMQPEPNPQMGLRGVRLSLRQRTFFTTQLRALLRASASGPLKIMLPMVTMASEVREVRELLTGLAAEMSLPVPPLGAMIEVPMAALGALELADVCDFFSLGTNDLMQFLLAADRQHAGVGYLHEGEHPAVWRLLSEVMIVAHAAGIPVGVCGEWGADGEKLARLLDLGIDSISVAVGALPRVLAMFPKG